MEFLFHDKYLCYYELAAEVYGLGSNHRVAQVRMIEETLQFASISSWFCSIYFCFPM